MPIHQHTTRTTYDDIEPNDTLHWNGTEYSVMDKGTHISGIDGSHLKLHPEDETSQMDPFVLHERLVTLWIHDHPEDFVFESPEVAV